MALAERPLQQLAPEDGFGAAVPLASIAANIGDLSQRASLSWHEGDDDLGAYDAAVVLLEGSHRFALVSYRDSPEPNVVVLGDQRTSPAVLSRLLAALNVRPGEVVDTVPTSMNRSELVERVAVKSGLSRRDAGAAIDAVLRSIEDALRAGEEVTFTGFGKFHVADRSERQGRNPRTGKRMTIAATRVPRFTAGSSLKKAID